MQYLLVIFVSSLMVKNTICELSSKSHIFGSRNYLKMPGPKNSDTDINCEENVGKCQLNRLRENQRKISEHRVPLLHRIARQTQFKTVNQEAVDNNQPNTARLNPFVWHKFQHHATMHKPLVVWSNPVWINKSHTDTLPELETAQLDPINDFTQPFKSDQTKPLPGNVLIDLLDTSSGQYSPQDDKNFQNPPTKMAFAKKILKPLFVSYLSGFANSLDGMMTTADCSLAVHIVPSVLINSFLDTITTINKIQGLNVLTIPLLVLSTINLMMSFVFLEECCPGLN